jgi:hypothetical protein
MRPCEDDHPLRCVEGQPFVAGRDCPVCWHYLHSPKYRARWDDPKWENRRRKGKCLHRGPVTAWATLPGCNGRPVDVPVFGCDVHGRCIRYATNDDLLIQFAAAVERGEVPSLWQCNLCRDRQEPTIRGPSPA